MSNPTIDKAKGQFKEAVGKVTGDRQLETEGQIDQASATVREKAADIKAGVAEAVGNVIERVGAVASDIKDKVTGKG
ncbi:MAG TPA: CsbD family protein [Candidatus Competibacteraceae bacterium]|nr:CsbD family protein [Candidatus Competibacteraceae bacterium]HRZ05928.1 CsbD family protein [Candidatus Competibacteraceae bacterium]HSA48015.1 CsbD family protein [Candidatus Competibacteraceae bacterium]